MSTTALTVRGATARVNLRAAVPVVALVFPIAAGIFVGDEDGGDVLRVLEAELGRDAQLHRGAALRRAQLVAELEAQLLLRMQRARLVDRAVIVVGALE